MEEIWKDIEGYEGLYQVSNVGRVRSFKYKKERILKQGITRKGYKSVILYTNNSPKHYTIHRLVANAFIPNPDNLPQVNHKDENKTNNCMENLEWCDGKYNVNYGTGNKRRARTQSKKVLQFKPDGTFVKEWESAMAVERNLGFAHTHISDCCRGKYAHAYGYIWKFKKEIE